MNTNTNPIWYAITTTILTCMLALGTIADAYRASISAHGANTIPWVSIAMIIGVAVAVFTPPTKIHIDMIRTFQPVSKVLIAVLVNSLIYASVTAYTIGVTVGQFAFLVMSPISVACASLFLMMVYAAIRHPEPVDINEKGAPIFRISVINIIAITGTVIPFGVPHVVSKPYLMIFMTALMVHLFGIMAMVIKQREISNER